MSTFIRAKLVHKYYARLRSSRIWVVFSFFPLRNTNQYCVLRKRPLHKYLIILIYKRNVVCILYAFKHYYRNINTSFDVVNIVIAVAMDIAKSNRAIQVRSRLVNSPNVFLCRNGAADEMKREGLPIFLRTESKVIHFCARWLFLFGHFYYYVPGWLAGSLTDCIQHSYVTYGF